jgi:hypothetical protein
MELILAGTQVDRAAILVAVAMGAAAAEALTAKPIAKSATAAAHGPTTSSASRSVTSTSLEPGAEARVDPQPKAGSEVIIREVMIEDAAPLRSAPMPETGISSRGGLELLNDDLIDPAFVSLSMESWHRTENWIKVRCEYPRLSFLIEY